VIARESADGENPLLDRTGETLRPMTEGEFTGAFRRLPVRDRENS
jgi:hypothetical protein